MTRTWLPPDWSPSRPHYIQQMVDSDQYEYGEAFAAMAGEDMMDFGSAISAVKQGHKLYREDWGTPGACIRLEGVDKVVHAAEGRTKPYTPDSADMLAEDWRYMNLPDSGDAVAGDPLAQRTYAGSTPAGQIDGPTIPRENIENDNVQYVDTASVGPVPVGADSGVSTERDGPEIAGIPMPRAAG